MIDIYTEHHPHQHPVEPIEHLKMVGAQYYTSLLSKLTSHINNTDVHVTNEDKVKWEKAFLDIKDLKDKVDDIDTSGNKDHTIDLDAYATKTWVESQGYAYKNQTPTYQDLQQYATIMYVDNAIKNIVIPEGDWVTEDELNRATANLATNETVTRVRDEADANVHWLDEKCENTYMKKTDVPEYTLMPATTERLGGFKVGSVSGANNYAVQMNGEYAYVNIPFQTTGGDDITVTESYDVEVVSCTVRMEPIYEGSSQMKVTGYVTWKVAKTIGSSRSYVTPGDLSVSSTARLLPSNEALSLSTDVPNSTFIGSTTPHSGSEADYVAITVEKDGAVVCRLIFAIKEPGQKGDSAAQYIPDAMIRLRGAYNANEEYSNGDYLDDYGCKWIDVVSFNGIYYKAKKNGRLSAPVLNGQDNTAEWDRFAMFSDAAFNSVIAKYLSAQSITAEQIVILKNYDSTNPIPVAGIVGKNTYNYNGVDYDLIRVEPGNDNNPIVIFAGTNSGNITNAPFRVYQDGSIVTTNARIEGSLSSVVVSGSPDGINNNEASLTTGGIVFTSTNLRGNYSSSVMGNGGITVSSATSRTTITPSGILTPVISAESIDVVDLNVTGMFNFDVASLLSGMNLWVYICSQQLNYLAKFEGGLLISLERVNNTNALNPNGNTFFFGAGDTRFV